MAVNLAVNPPWDGGTLKRQQWKSIYSVFCQVRPVSGGLIRIIYDEVESMLISVNVPEI
jgi:hypothetical protein